MPPVMMIVPPLWALLLRGAKSLRENPMVHLRYLANSLWISTATTGSGPRPAPSSAESSPS